jgi:hypothetical protein
MKVLYLEILPSNRIISMYFVLLLVNIQKSLIKIRDFLGKVLSVYTVPPPTGCPAGKGILYIGITQS